MFTTRMKTLPASIIKVLNASNNLSIGGVNWGGTVTPPTPPYELPEYSLLKSTEFLDSTHWSSSPVHIIDGAVYSSNSPRFNAVGSIGKTDGVIAVKVLHGEDPDWNGSGGTVRFRYGSDFPSIKGINYDGSFGDYILGEAWRYSTVEDLIAEGMVPNSDPSYFDFRTVAEGPSNCSSVGIKPLVLDAQGIPTIVITMDDGGSGQYNHGYQIMKDNGIRSTLHIPWDNLGESNKLTVAQLQEMAADGFDIQIDSRGDGGPITASATVADAVLELNRGRQFLQDKGLNPNAEMMCYHEGVFREAGTAISNVNITAGVFGSDVVTVSDASNVTVGMTLANQAFPVKTTVVAKSGNDVTLSNAAQNTNRYGETLTEVPQDCTFHDFTGEFSTGKLQAAMAASGWLVGRTTRSGYHHSRFGVGDQGLVLFSQSSTLSGADRSDDALVAKVQGWIDTVKKEGTTCISYWHNILEGSSNGLNSTVTGFTRVCELLKSEVDQGNIQVLTLKEWWDRDCRNPVDPYA